MMNRWKSHGCLNLFEKVQELPASTERSIIQKLRVLFRVWYHHPEETRGDQKSPEKHKEVSSNLTGTAKHWASLRRSEFL